MFNLYKDFLESIYSKEISKIYLSNYDNYNKYIDYLGKNPELLDLLSLNFKKEIFYEEIISSNTEDLNELSLFNTYPREIVYLHRYILICRISNICSNDKGFSPINDIINSSKSLLDFEIRIKNPNIKTDISVDSSSKYNSKKFENMSHNYRILGSIIYNTLFIYDTIWIWTRNYNIKSFKNNSNVLILMVYKKYKYWINVDREKYLYFNLDYLESGWNIYLIKNILNPYPNIKDIRNNILNIEYTGKMIYGEITYNHNYTSDIFIESKEYVLPKFKDGDIVEKLGFLDIINKLNNLKYELNKEIIEKYLYIYINKEHNNVYNNLEKAIVSDKIETVRFNESLLEYYENRLKNCDVFYLTHLFDKRGRIYIKQIPFNYQLNKFVRYMIRSEKGVINKDIDTILYLVEKNFFSDEELKIIFKKIPNNCEKLKNIYDIIKVKYDNRYHNILESTLYMFYILLVQIYEKINNKSKNNEYLKKYEDKIYDYMIYKNLDMNSIYPNESDDWSKIYSYNQIRDSFHNGEFCENIVYIDACGSVFQLLSIWSSTIDPKTLSAVGFLDEPSDGVYNIIVNSLNDKMIKDEKFNWLKYVNRDCIKKTSMPRIYGQTYAGMCNVLYNHFGKENMLRDINNINEFLKYYYTSIDDILKDIGLDPKELIDIVKEIFESNENIHILNSLTQFPIVFKKGNIKNVDEKRKRTTKNLAFIDEYGSKSFRLMIKRDISNFDIFYNKKITFNGCFVGLIHNGDSTILIKSVEFLYNLIKIESSITMVHDSVGSSIWLLNMLEISYKKALILYGVEILNTWPLENYINMDKSSPKLKIFLDKRKKNNEKLKKILYNILNKERIIF